MLQLVLALATASPWAIPVSSWVKVRPGLRVAPTSAQLLAARGECEAFQVFVPPPMGGVSLEPVRLSNGPRSIDATLYREEFVPVRTPSNSAGAPGLWPDPLIPLEAHPVDSTEQKPLVIYAELCVPVDAAPGQYAGVARLSAEGRPPLRIPVSLDVQRYVLPATSSLPNSFGLSLFTIAKGHRLKPEDARPLLWEYARALLRHRVTPHGLTMEYDEAVLPFLRGTALPSGARFTTLELKDPLEALVPRVKKLGIAAEPFFYAKDEPRAEDVPVVLAQSSRARASGVPVLVTSPYDPTLADAADIFAPALNCFFPRPGPQTCRAVMPVQQLRAKLRPRAKVWWYQSCLAHGCTAAPAAKPDVQRAFTGWASYMVDHPATLNRAMGVLAFIAGVDGELYYDTVHAYGTKPDPWDDVFDFGGNGDGTLFYPGRPDRVGGTQHRPIESLRLKHLRDGLEDYEALRLLARTSPELASKCAQRLARSGYDIEQDPATWEDVRRVVANALGRADNESK